MIEQFSIFNKPRALSRNPLYWMILDICFFVNFTLIAELFAKELQIFEICVM